MILIEKNDERQCVESLDGYDGWTVVEERDTPPPEHADWVDGVGFVVDQQKVNEAVEEDRLKGMPRAALVAEIEAKMADRIAFLENELAKRDVQIAELALATQFVVTPLNNIIIEPSSTEEI